MRSSRVASAAGSGSACASASQTGVAAALTGSGGGAGSPRSRAAEMGRRTGASGWTSRRRSLRHVRFLRRRYRGPGLFETGAVEQAQQREDEDERRQRAGEADPGARLEAERRLGGGEERRQAARADQPGQQVAGHGEGDEGDREAGQRRHRQIERIAPEAPRQILERPRSDHKTLPVSRW